MTSEALSFIIVGGSIAGLSCAYTLQQAGHKVTVLEKNIAPYYNCPGAVHSPPNLTRTLKAWGLTDWLNKYGVKADAVVFRQGDTGEKIGILIYHPQIMDALGADYNFVPFRAFWSLLYDKATEAGAAVQFGKEVIRMDPEQPSVTTSDGENMTADFIIGADGYESITRQCVVEHTPKGVMDRRCGFVLTVPTALLKEDKDLVSLTELPEWNIWLGDGSCIHGFLSMRRQEYILNLILDKSDQRFHQNWDGRYSVSDLNLNLSGYDPHVRKLVKLADKVTPTTYRQHEALPNLVHDTGLVLLVGEAAHPLPPNFNQNAPISVEDAVTLGGLMTRAKSKDQAISLLSVYEELRISRSAQVSKSEHNRYEMVTIPLGTDSQKLRDDSFRASLPRASRGWEDADEEYLQEVWDDYIAMFNYDASEAVQDWFAKWGAFV